MSGLRVRVALVALSASAVALMFVLLAVGPGLRERSLDTVRTGLVAEARLMARVVAEPLARGVPRDEVDAVVDLAAREVSARVTLMTTNGSVVADSALSGAALSAVENHGDRPEVREALAEGVGSAVRRSQTVADDLLYAAVPVRRPDGALLGVVRVALPLTDVTAQTGALRSAVALALVVAFAMTAILSALLASSLAGPLSGIVESARRFAAGDLSARLPVGRTDELGELASILNRAGEQLQARLADTARERARTETILSAMDDGVLAVDAAGKVVLANDTLRRLVGGPDPVGRDYVEVLRQREVGLALQHVLATGERQQLEDVRLLQSGRVYALAGVPFPATAGERPGAVLTFHDVTERRRLEQIRRDFVANASHELRTPLTSIRGFVEALEDGALGDPEKGPRFLGKIHRHANQMAALVDDLLELSRLESGERPPDAARVDLAGLVEDVVASFDERAQRKYIRLSASIAAAPAAFTDADRVRRIVANLVENALKYTPVGGSVTVRTGPTPEGGATIEVRDDGPGIGAEHLPRLFERFYRVDKARSREQGGTGLGLAIVKHLAESLGARVTVQSEPGRGSVFTLVLPPSR